MAAVALVAGALVVHAVGSVESLGYLSGRSTIDLLDLPFGPTKAEHVEMLRELARDTDVSLALLTPERSGTPNALDAIVLRGHVTAPTFWGRITERPTADARDAVIVWTYAVDGTPSEVASFLAGLRERGFVFSTATPAVVPTLVATLSEPGVATLCLVTVLGALIALVAESHRRARRQRLRRLVGWSPGRILAQEAFEVAVLVAVSFGVVSGALGVFLAVRGAAHPVWAFTTISSGIVVAVAAPVVVVLHAAFAAISGRCPSRADVGRWRPAVVAVSGVVLVASSAVTSCAYVAQSGTTEVLERSLAAEAAHGDDVVLGVGFPDDRQEQVLGAIGARAIEHGRARMAMTNGIGEALLVVGDGTPGVPAAVARRDGITVLVPRELAGDADRIEPDVRADIAGGWEVDEAAAPRQPRVRTVIVPSTRPIVEAAERWVEWTSPEGAGWPEIPVVVSDLRDIAPNRIATATRNGEVRFADRAALEHALRQEGVLDVVTQINRVGAVVDRKLAAVRNERLVLFGVLSATVLVVLFAATTLVVDHRTRRRAAERLRSQVGRHPSVQHARFVLAAAGVCAVTVLGALVSASTVGLGVAAASAAASGTVVAALLAALIPICRPRGGERA